MRTHQGGLADFAVDKLGLNCAVPCLGPVFLTWSSPMAFRFLHTADWHIGKPFGRFDEELAPQLRRARLNAIDRIAEHARAHSVTHVLAAGDLFDQSDVSNKDVAAVLERLATSAPVHWWLLPGNHDPASAHGVWWRISQSAFLALPENVHVLVKPNAIEIERGVYVLPSPAQSHDPGHDITAWMDDGATPEGALRIGLAHGSTAGFGEDSERGSVAADAVIADTRPKTARLDYLALGDWHGQKQVSARTWYSGTPEPDRFRDNAPGGCLLVELTTPGADAQVTRLETSEFTWKKIEADVRSRHDIEEVFAQLVSGGARSQNLLAQVTLTGELSAQDFAQLDKIQTRYQDTLAYLEVRAETLATLVTDGDLDTLDHGGMLRHAGEALVRQSQDETLTAIQRMHARRALAYLFTFCEQKSAEDVR